MPENRTDIAMSIWAIVNILGCLALLLLPISIMYWVAPVLILFAFLHILLYHKAYWKAYLEVLHLSRLYRKLSKKQNKMDTLLIQSAALYRRDALDPKRIDRLAEEQAENAIQEALNTFLKKK